MVGDNKKDIKSSIVNVLIQLSFALEVKLLSKKPEERRERKISECVINFISYSFLY